MKKNEGSRLVVRYMIIAAALILLIMNFNEVLGFLKRMQGIFFPLLMGAVIAYILNILMVKLEKIYFPKSKRKWVIKTRRMVCIVLSIFMVAGILIFVIALVIPELVGALQVIGVAIPVYFDKISTWLLTYSDQFPLIEEWLANLEINWEQLFKNIMAYATSGVSGLLNSTISIVSVVAGGVINFVIALIFAIYLLVEKENLFRQVKKVFYAYVSEHNAAKAAEVWRVVNKTFSNFIVGQCTEAVILGSLCTIGMLLLGFPYAPMTGAFIGVTALLPVVGAYLGAGLGAFMILTVNPMQAVFFLIFIVVLQQLEGNLIYPKVVGSSVGLPAIWVLAAVTIGGGFGGLAGMLFGVPVAATLYKLLAMGVNARTIKKEGKRSIEKTEAKKEKEEEEEEEAGEVDSKG